MTEEAPSTRRWNFWTAGWRWLVFLLASTSLGCLLADFYQFCSMQTFTVYVFLPAMVVLFGLACLDRVRGDLRLWRAVWIGLAGGLAAAVAYDVFRLPFVFAQQWGIASVVPQMGLFKVFPRFGTMILGQPLEQPAYSMAAQVIGWAYHFSNGATIGVMYMVLLGDAARRHWAWAILLATGLEAAMLLTPYPQVFGITVDARFVAVTMAAHALFGVGLGLVVKRLARVPAPQTIARTLVSG